MKKLKSMKVSAKQYARLLWNCLEEQGESKRVDVMKNFVQILWRRKQLRLENKIITALKNIEKEKGGLIEAKVKSAYEVSNQAKKKIKDFIKKKLNCQKVELDFQVDKNLIGGIVVEAEGYVWDMSVSGGINKLKQAIK